MRTIAGVIILSISTITVVLALVVFTIIDIDFAMFP